ncbi:hypothetical protein WICMUC_004613 [Wickerhamomyces mucosus]|uniref:Midasin n=1 Tax=Wickerhamomyces mucosus TaxID=1378264 RepID=A0A9P8T9J9_9ASCO|nr:hypothetical protein WICMUC_004613 [Wickerhamomyces mucosus]
MGDQISLNYTQSLKKFQKFISFYEKKSIPKESLEIDTSKSIKENLVSLSIKSLDSKLTTALLYALDNLYLDFISRWISDTTIELEYSQSKNIQLCINGSIVLSSLGRIISLTPQVSSLVEHFLQQNNIFEQIESKFDIILSTTNQSELKEILLAFNRLLTHDLDRFSKFVSPDTISKILRSSSNNIIKYLSILILSKYLNFSEKATNDTLNNFVGDSSLSDDFENDKNIDYRFLSTIEAKRLSNFDQLKSFKFESDAVKDSLIIIESSSLSKFVVSVCGILVPKVHFDQQLSTSTTFVPTERSISTLRQLAIEVQNSSPVMLVGGAGSGKTFLINELSKYLACDKTLVKIHLGEQTDAKLLLGTYTSGAKPGTFEWRSGVLTTAVTEGRWVLIEDIDKAPTEVLSVLLSLLEKRELTIPSRGEIIKAANGFQLIATIRTSNDLKKKPKTATLPDLIGLRLWKILNVEDPTKEELSKILSSQYPVLERLIPSFITLFDSIQTTYNSKSFLVLNRGSHPRVISSRDLIKFCQRVNIIFQNSGINSSNHLLESSVIDDIFSEAVDCFASAINEFCALEPLIKVIGESLQIASSRIQVFLNKHVPGYEDYEDRIVIGRAHLDKSPSSLYKKKNTGNNTSFARTNHSLRLMEQIGVAVQMTEPVLLVGETGTGKTTVVQQVAKQLNKELTVINVSQQTETGDLLGGYKPVNTKAVAVPIQEDFFKLFHLTFSAKKNEKFEKALIKCFNRSQWKNVIKLWNEAIKLANQVLTKEDEESKVEPTKKKRRLTSHDKKSLLDRWDEMKVTIKNFEVQSQALENSFVFNFIEGSLVKAVRNGDWLLLDEINLASPDTLESISDLLVEATQRSILLSEKGQVESIQAHKDFRIFACMNPATDVGKRDLPLSIRSRFTEIYVHSPDADISDLLQIIDRYVGRFALSDEWVGNDIAQLYLEAKELSESNKIVDGANQKPHFSIRTLTRTLLYVVDIVSIYGLRRSLFEGFSMSFLTLLDKESEQILKPLIEKYTIGRLKNAKSVISQTPPDPSSQYEKYVQFKHYWMRQGPFEVVDQPHYIITPFVEKNMLNLVRATSGKKFPILVQGPTSSGKTSMIKYLADITGNKFVRINNHEHTDLQEYLGTYVSDDTGKLSFKEGVLVEALKKGYWLVLDELNLAPTDVLEALNRLLDDNRELFIPETQEVVHPHPDFMLFATQNPPGLYGGRKVLSRAFRNRFLELHFDDIPQDELEIILRERCQIAPTYAKRIVEVYRQLSVQRQSSRLFEQKNSFATLRDLFRWAMREAVGYEQLAANGYMLLAERVRKSEEKIVVKEVLEKVMKVKLDMDDYYKSLENENLMKIESSVVWTKALRRLAVLIQSSLSNNEPILLVGETGCGKTTVCQLLAEFHEKHLITVNAHQNTETGDLLGAQRPVRNKSELQAKLHDKLITALSKLEIEIKGVLDLDELSQLYDSVDLENLPHDIKKSIQDDRNNMNVVFEWTDGPLIQALKTGQYFLLDEISLADDSVLERLNSVLEPERSLLLAEKGTDDSFITAKDGFQFLATMNPGGDYGKKELSPALRNRFTEIWVPSMEDFDDVTTIVEYKLSKELKSLASTIVKFSESFGKTLGGGNISSGVISLRDILAWVEFVNSSYKNTGSINGSLLHGAAMVFIDALGTNNTAYLAESEERLNKRKLECVLELSNLVGENLSPYYSSSVEVNLTKSSLKAGIFETPVNSSDDLKESFSFKAPTTAANAMRVVRAMQVRKPILLEGSPGVGKTSLVSALAKATGNALTRINLSEQTDLVDLFGSDAPVEGGKTGEFVWRDAPFLRAMKYGEWVLLDEMNLASQSVLEGLNACLDHRGEAYIPELDKSFPRHKNFLVFAAQNPQYQGGGRKGLPKSFVNRFSVVYVDTLSAQDLVMIAHHLHPNIDAEICSKMIQVVSKLEEAVSIKKIWGNNGSPWEFNLRDTLRWLDLYDSEYVTQALSPVDFMNIIITQRFRAKEDRQHARLLINAIFEETPLEDNFFNIGENFVQARKAIVPRSESLQFSSHSSLNHLHSNCDILESSLLALKNNWPVILVGPTNSGKTDLVRYLATVTGSQLVEFSMNSDIDSMDILGGYEQLDLTREITTLLYALESQLKRSLVYYFKHSSDVIESNVHCLQLLKFIKSNRIVIDNYAEFMKRFEHFNSSINQDLDFQELSLKFRAVQEKIKEVNSVRFEWFDGLLVKAVEEGHWLVLDNANLCSPSVLDRLNSLLETNGSLIMNECSLADGHPRVLKPHKNFRLFLTVDPKFGELSRAMRNRGVEIYMDDIDDRSSLFDKKVLSFPELETDGSSSQNGEKTTAVSKYVGCTDSSSFHLSLVLDSMMFSTLDSALPTLLATVTPFITQNHALGLSSTILVSSEFDNSLREKFNDFTSFIKRFSELDVSKRLLDLYTSPGMKIDNLLSNKINFDVYQTLNPIWNIYIKSALEGSSRQSPSELIYFFELVGETFRAITKLSEIETRAIHGKISDLSYIEQGAAVFNGRSIRNSPRLNVFSLLKQVLDFILHSVKNFEISEIISSTSVFESLYGLVTLWISLFDSTRIKDEAKTRVFQKMIRKWSKENTNKIAVEKLNEILNRFDEDLKLNRGQMMSPIWEKFRGNYPQSSETWGDREELIDIMKKLDSISFKQYSDSDDIISQLSNSVLGLYDQISTSATPITSSVFGDLRSSIKNLEALSSQFLIQRSHNFQESFELLFNFVISKNQLFDNDILKLSHYAGLGASALIDFESTVYPRVFETLWKKSSNGYSSRTASLFTNQFLESVLLNIGNYNDFSGDQLDQTVQDSLVFSKLLIRNSSAVVENMLIEHRTIILDWYIKLFSLVSPVNIADILKENFTSESISSIVSASSSIESESFIKVNENFFIPAISFLSNLNGIDELGQAWVLFSIGLIQLYVPDAAYDPAIEEHVLYENFQLKKKLCSAISEAMKSIRTVKFGDDFVYLERYSPAVNEDAIPKKPRVYRSKISIHNLFEEWQSLMSSTLDLSALKILLEASEDSLFPDLENQFDLFQQNTSSFIERLNSKFYHFSDVNDIFKGHIFCLKLGFDLILESQRNLNAQHRISPLWFININEFSHSRSFNRGFDELREFSKTLDVDSSNAEQIMRFLFNLIFSSDQENFAQSEKIQQVFQTLYYRWSLRRARQEQKEAEEGSLFKYNDNSESDEEFKALFPDFEEFLDINDGSITRPTSEILKREYTKFAQDFISFMLDKKGLSTPQLTHEGALVAKNLLQKSSSFIKSSITSSELSAIIVELSDSIDNARLSVKSTDLDFYHGYSPVELKKSVEVVQRLLRAVVDLLVQWPEHATLQTLKRISYEYLYFPVKTPLARLIQKVEQIYTFISEWEKYASSKVSLKSSFDEFTTLIVSWRRLELSTWKSLFDREDAANEASIGEWWFNLFEVIVLPVYTGEQDYDISSIISSLNIFISKSTYGQFLSRLRLLKAFSEYIGLINFNGRINNTLRNIVTYYEQFIPLIDDYIVEGKKKLQKDIEEVILLASWKDVNIDALKQSSRRSHASLYKIVRKYRALLSGAIQPLIENGLSSSNKVITHKIPLAAPRLPYLDLDAVTTECQSIDTWKERPSHLKNLSLLDKNMGVYTARISEKSYPRLLTFAQETLSEMERLKGETPKELKEENKKLVAALKTQKRKLLSDTIRELKRIGLKSHLKEDIHKVQATTGTILSKSQSFYNTKLEGSDKYFFRVIDLLPRLRASISNVAEDVPPADAERALAITEDLVSYMINNRKPLNQIAKFVEKFEGLQKQIELASNSKGSFICKNKVSSKSSQAVFALKLLPQVLEQAIHTAGISSKLGEIDIDTSLFYEIKSKLQEFNEILCSNWNFSEYFDETLESFFQYLEDIISTIETWKGLHNNVSFIGDLIIDWILKLDTVQITPVDSTKASLEIVESKLLSLSRRILVIFQKVTQAQNTAPISSDDDEWFRASQKELSETSQSLYSKSIFKVFEELLSFITSSDFSKEDSVSTRSLIRFSMPFLHNYLKLSFTVLDKLRENYIDLSHSTYVLATSLLNVAKDGFCSPEPPTESKEDENLQDGTGLGDGEGATNNSKDVEDDEDLTENAQEPNKDQNQDENEDDENDDAVDIEGDMAGETENLSDQEKEDDNNDDEDKDELDEEIDDLDDLDPNAVDDKMWDEEAKEENKEKESETMPENSKQDDLQAKEDEDDSGERDTKDQEEDKDKEDENGSDGEEDVAEQEDQVKNEDQTEELDQKVPEQDALDLPDDINLDSDGEEKEEEEENGEAFEDNIGADDNDFSKEEDESDEEQNEGKVEEEGLEEKEGDEEDESEEFEGDNHNDDEIDDNENSNEAEAIEAEEQSDNEDLKEIEKAEENENEDDGGDEKEDGDQMEGIEGADTGSKNNDDIDLETAVEQQSGEQGDGAQADVEEEKEDVGASGTASHQQQSDDKQDADSNDDARNDARESLKQLGDSLKEFHRRHQEIKEKSEKDETAEQKSNERPDEFEHVDGQNTETDTQALGAANKDQVTSINDEMAIDDDEEQDQEVKDESEKHDDALDSDVEELQNHPDEKPEEFDGKTKGGMIGERKKEDVEDEDDEIFKGETHEEMGDDELDNDESAILDPEVVDNDAELRDIDEARDLWRKSELETQELVSNLCEQLRLILEPTLSTKLKGDYKTGKRLNMKRIIPYIASDFRKDKIWLRRTKPSKRQYQIMIAVDDSKSMSESKSVDLAFQSICLVSKALTQLESGELSIVKFGEDTKVVHPFGKQFSSEVGAQIFQRFDFQQTRTNIRKLVSQSLDIFNSARSLGNSDLWQLQIIISDGLCEDHETIQRLVRRAREEKIMLVFVIIDGINSSESIMDMSQVNYIPDVNGNMVLKVDKYLDTFPFEFYVVVHDIAELPKMLSLILRQYFQETASV